jgi:transposase
LADTVIARPWVSRRGCQRVGSTKRKSYSPAYRGEAALLVINIGRRIAVVAREIGVGAPLLGRWVAVERAQSDSLPGALDVDVRAELDRLRVENSELPH